MLEEMKGRSRIGEERRERKRGSEGERVRSMKGHFSVNSAQLPHATEKRIHVVQKRDMFRK